MGSFGVRVIEDNLLNIKKKYQIDVVLAQAENVTLGKGISVKDYYKLKFLGIDGLTAGNHIYQYQEIKSLIENDDHMIVGLANYGCQKRYKILSTASGDILFFSLLGQIVGKDANIVRDNPLKIADEILTSIQNNQSIKAIIVNFHGDYSSEKVMIGHYLDGRVQAVIGDHWHVPTNDARILPGGTAHITDVGMCGALNASLGVQADVVINRWLTGRKTKNILENNGKWQFNAVNINLNSTYQVNSINTINLVG